MFLFTADKSVQCDSDLSTNCSDKPTEKTPPKLRLILALALLFAMPALTAVASEPAEGSTNQPSPGFQQRQDAGETAATSEKYRRAGEIIRQMLRPEVVTAMERKEPSPMFGGELPRLAFENSMADLWTRPALSLKERSLITLGMLIALGVENELRTHFESGLRNGLTVEQLEEII